MADLVLTKYSWQLANQLVSARRSRNVQGEETGLQRIGILKSNTGTTVTCYYDPSSHTIYWDDGTPVLSQE